MTDRLFDLTTYNVKLQYGCDTCGTVTETYTAASTPILQSLSCNINGCKGIRILTSYKVADDFITKPIENPPSKSCGRDMGGVWLPDRFGIEVFIPVRCNRDAHDGGLCSYTDVKSGMVIHADARFPTITVDDRGCVQINRNISQESENSNFLVEYLNYCEREYNRVIKEAKCSSLRRSRNRNVSNTQAIAEHRARVCLCVENQENNPRTTL